MGETAGLGRRTTVTMKSAFGGTTRIDILSVGVHLHCQVLLLAVLLPMSYAVLLREEYGENCEHLPP